MIHSNESAGSLRTELAAHTVAQILCLGVFALLFQPWKADLRIPVVYGSDALIHAGWIQNIVETGWYETNDRFGYPGRQDLRDFPSADSLHHLTFKLMALLTTDTGVLLNLFYFLTFPLTTFTSLFVLRRMRVAAPIAIVVSLLYTFQPYHLLRVTHLLLSAYYLAPFACLIAVRIYQDRPFLAREDGPRGASRRDALAAAFLCAAFGASGAYYAFFSCFLILIGGLAGACTNRKWLPLLRAGVLCAIAFLTFLASVAVALQQRIAEPNADVAVRLPAEAEGFGLKIVQMLMPVAGHRVGALRTLEGTYSLGPTPLVNENASAALGLVGAIGLIYLLSRAVLKRGTGHGATLDGLAAITLAAVLLATIGGFGSAFAFTVSPWIRGYNRISIFIAFAALAASALLLDAAWRRLAQARRGPTVGCTVAIVVLGALGLLDQTHRRMVPPPDLYRDAFRADQDFIRQLEARVPEQSAIALWPNCPYPNAIVQFDSHAFSGHDHLRPLYHSRTVRWSYGSMAGHRGFLWNHRLEQMALEQQCIVLVDAGFEGICVNRHGYADRGQGILKDLEAMLGPPSLVSSDQRLYYFGLGEFAARLRPARNEVERERRRDLALNPVLVYWTTGFFEEQTHPKTKQRYRWGRRSAQFILDNGSRESQTVRLRFTVAVPEVARAVALTIRSDLFSETLTVDPTPVPFERTIEVPPGRHRVEFSCAAPVQPVWQEPAKRGIVFRIGAFHCEDVLNENDSQRLCEETAHMRP